jgi:TRAP-type C4-dicarboxylate transport system substrate-binding protein
MKEEGVMFLRGKSNAFITGFFFTFLICFTIAPIPLFESTGGGTKQAQAQTPQPIKLKLGTFVGVKGLHADVINYFTSEVKKRTNGRVEIETIWSEGLAKVMELPDAVRLGTADIAYLLPAYKIETYPFLSTTMVVHFSIEVPVTKDINLKGLKVYRQLAEQFPEVKDELRKQNQVLLGTFTYEPETVLSRKQISSLSQMKGWKVRTWGFMTPKIISAIGAVPVSIPAVETYDAMSKGVADGTIATLETTHRYKYTEVAKYWCENLTRVIPAWPFVYGMTANLDVWNKLPKNFQDIMLKVGEEASGKHGEWIAESAPVYLKELTGQRGMVLYKVPDAEIEALRTKMTATATEDYAQRVQKLGYPRIKEVIQKHIEAWKAIR